MKISKEDALTWFTFFASLDEEEELLPRQEEIVYAVLSQIEEAVEQEHQERLKQIPNLKTMDDRTYFVGEEGKFPAGCRSCLCGRGLSPIRKTNRCNLHCPFCYDYAELEDQPPVGEGLWEIGETKYREEDLPMLLRIQGKPSGVSYVYLEPFLEIEKYYGCIRTFHQAGVHQHLYTNGTLANEENLKALGEAGLDELRFNLGASGCADEVIEHMEIARRYLPSVGIETPMTPQFYETFLQKKDQILATGIDFINCAELHVNPSNIENYAGENLYCYRQGYISPIFSRNLTLQLMQRAGEEAWPVVVHDCSNRTKLARGINQRRKEGAWFGAADYGSEFTTLPYWAFLPVLEDDSFRFLAEEPLPEGYRPGDLLI